MSAGGTNLTAAAGLPSAMGVMDVLHDNSKSMYHALPSLRAGHVHCAQLEDGFECIMQTVPIVASLSRHRCKGSCGRHIHAQCGHQLGDNEMDRVCYRCSNENEHGGKRPRITTTSTIVPDVIDPTLVKLTGVLEKFKKGELKPLSMRLFARGSSLTGGPGMINCSCGKTGKCTSCKCAKAGRRCNSSCRCSRFSMCTNMEAMEALDKAILERRELDDVNVALTRSELA